MAATDFYYRVFAYGCSGMGCMLLALMCERCFGDHEREIIAHNMLQSHGHDERVPSE